MADSASASFVQSDTLGLRCISSTILNIPGLLLGFGSRGSLDSDLLWSPTSPLDFSFFSNLSHPFGRKSPRSPSLGSHKKKWDCSKVGLGIINVIVDEAEAINSPERKNIIFGPQVKSDNCVRLNSSQIKCTVSVPSETSSPNSSFVNTSPRLSDERVHHQLEPLNNSSLAISTKTSNLRAKRLGLENRAATIASLPLVIAGSSKVNNFDIEPSSLPIAIRSSHGFTHSLSAREIELSEDYTRVISHGPNTRTTHIFGGCILEYHTSELSNFGESNNLCIDLAQEDKHLEVSPPNASHDFLSFCQSCKKIIIKGEDIYIYRGEKAFCSFDCRSEEIIAEEETRMPNNNSSKSSPGSSYHEDLFLFGNPIAA